MKNLSGFAKSVRLWGKVMARFQVAGVKVSWTALLAVAHFTYLLVGATIFQILEREAESNSRHHFQLEKLNFLANYTCLDGPALEQFVQVRPLLSVNFRVCMWSLNNLITSSTLTAE